MKIGSPVPEQMLDFATLHGRVISGRGTASKIKGFSTEIINFFGEPPVRGSLNLALDKPIRFDPEQVELKGRGRSFFWAGEIDGMRCLITRAKGHPLHIIEIIAPCKLRDRFQLHDGDWLELQVSRDILIENLSWSTKAIWNIFWRFRECWYVSKTYRALIGPFWLMRRLATQSPQHHAKLWNRKKLRNNILVCHINLARDPKLRGGERQTEILIDALAAEGVSRQRIVMLRRGPLAQRIHSRPDLEVCRVRSRLSAAFVCRGASLLHAHEAHAAQAAYAASLFGKQYLITRRLTKPVRSNSYSSAVYRNAQTVVALTEAVENSLQDRFPEISTVRIPDAWNPEYPDPGGVREIRKRFLDKFIIGHAAAMDGPEKGQSILLQAAQALQQDAPEIQFILLGSGRLEGELRQQAEDLNNVCFAGWVEDPITWIAAFDLFAFPSLIEPLGSTLLDVLRAGVPIVASEVDGIPEIITEGCGILVPPGDAGALAEQLLRLYRSEELRQRLSEKGLERAKEFSPELIAREHIRVYQDHGLVLD